MQHSPPAEQAGPAGRSLLIVLAYRAAMDGASHKEVVDLADHGLDDGRSLTAETDGLPLPFAMRLLGWIDELDRADRVHQSLLAAAREGSIVAFAIAAVCAASTAMRRGQLAVAEAEGRTATALSVQHDLKFYEPFARACGYPPRTRVGGQTPNASRPHLAAFAGPRSMTPMRWSSRFRSISLGSSMVSRGAKDLQCDSAGVSIFLVAWSAGWHRLEPGHADHGPDPAGRRGRPDGAAGALGGAVPLIQGRALGWPAWCYAMLAAAVPVFALFGWRPRRIAATGGWPLISPALFRHRSFTAGPGISLLVTATVACFGLTFSMLLQTGHRYSPVHAVLTALFLTLGIDDAGPAGVTGHPGRRPRPPRRGKSDPNRSDHGWQNVPSARPGPEGAMTGGGEP